MQIHTKVREVEEKYLGALSFMSSDVTGLASSGTVYCQVGG